ncbi:type I restriction enzyme HsdR N-terminal domain-containing protein [Psychromonas aquimarina]|uniref:type I restriction enzyme HsdR N-terminal domain-containing protein n=1 Tax=Psychromonas aquimarina TaxID=444919 RepID=UPI000411BF9C|nr:type I restriction enzyme HsdR N-terminal domain-containing protein [Psychromonas aquimarina]
MFDDFDFSLLDDPDFKEDSVREELILPIIKALGYYSNGDNKIVRSKSLMHPYVAIGSKQRKVSIIPDYMFLSEGMPYWILDAKSPTEEIMKSKHVEQAYSYAIHPEVRAKYYALCNGREFSLYSIDKFKPILNFSLENIGEYWEFLYRLLNPKLKANDEIMEYHPDYGIHMLKLGVTKGFKYIGLAVNINCISKIEDGLYTTTTVIPGDTEFIVSIDFNEEQLEVLLSMQPKHLAEIVRSGLKRQPYYIFLKNDDLKFGVSASLSNKIQENAEEQYVSFVADEFMEYCGLTESKP